MFSFFCKIKPYDIFNNNKSNYSNFSSSWPPAITSSFAYHFQPTFLKELSVLTVCECLPLTYSSLINPYQYSISQRLPLKIILLRLSMTLMAVHTMNVFQFSYLKSKSLKYVDHLIILKYSLFSPTPCFLPIYFLLIIAFLIYIPIVYYLIIKI